MKKTYETPTMEVIVFSTEDILADSNRNSQYVYNSDQVGTSFSAGNKVDIDW